ncbi:superoxide dismutase [Pyruvatibacter mobilis]|jgi:Fe-Mn family superoxide dismutase|uniref:Superoxide dismutase n=1 Tax=Pyruvatibacter mobilis TaxID=1712261 RepID=A0A845QCE5_9HYPH|nr:superoxide dismutase [Pyruvatibacter mobilis]NBG95968.1 superoxide dismutase [Fe] [Pyruvatibacter mobilis]QJD75094.1 superoxide dismutase [Pyruvatibacter mobilis]GGD12688.1 superoxide dismutase [Pyruvatibacter mobilis]
MSFALPDLPYAHDALEPHMSKSTFEFHHDKHHQKYVDTLNDLIKGTDNEGKSLEDIIKSSEGKLFNQAAQVWNHTFFWNSMTPNGGGKPTGAVAEAIDRDFGSYDKFAEEFSSVAAGEFGSGWAWLVADDAGKLSVISTHDADTPLAHGKKAIITLDVWEHAYYLDYQNKRPDYIKTFLDKLVNWDFANENLAA